MVAEARNPLSAQVGDVVRIRLSSRAVLQAALLLYLVPLLVFLGGLLLGQVLTHSQIWAVLLGFLFMAGSYTGIRALDRRSGRAVRFRPEIFEIVAQASRKTSSQGRDQRR
jgi:sigma-E factor negative regulatory protein RseC